MFKIAFVKSSYPMDSLSIPIYAAIYYGYLQIQVYIVRAVNLLMQEKKKLVNFLFTHTHMAWYKTFFFLTIFTLI